MATSQETSLVSSTSTAKEPRFTLRQIEGFMGYLMVAPLLTCILVLVVYPFFFAISISFTDRSIGAGGEFVGLANFEYLFSQNAFLQTITNTIVLITAVQTSKFLLGMGIAVLLNQRLWGRQFWRGLILLPWAMPAFVAFITWKLMYVPQGGAFNYVLIELGLVTTHVDFLGTRETRHAECHCCTCLERVSILGDHVLGGVARCT